MTRSRGRGDPSPSEASDLLRSLTTDDSPDPELHPRLSERFCAQAETFVPATGLRASLAADSSPSATDSLGSIQSRAARKLAIPGDGSDISLQYLYCDVYYTLEDGPSAVSPDPLCERLGLGLMRTTQTTTGRSSSTATRPRRR